MIWEYSNIRRSPGEWLKTFGSGELPEGILRSALTFLNEWTNTNETVLVRTSGSTGKPAEIALSKTLMRSSAGRTISYFGLKPGMRALLCLSPDHIAGKMMIVRALESGMDLVLREPGAALISADDLPFDIAAMVPLQIRKLMDTSPERLSQVRRMLVGGAELEAGKSEKLAKLIEESYETYGMTETASHVALRKCGAGSRKFVALPGIRFKTDERECLIVHMASPQMRVITNDCVRLLSETEFEWLGRVDHVVNSGGIKLHPSALETKIEGILDVPVYFTAVPDERLGQALILVIESGSRIDTGEVLARMEKRLDRYEMPKAVYCVPQFKRTENGKILRQWPI